VRGKERVIGIKGIPKGKGPPDPASGDSSPKNPQPRRNSREKGRNPDTKDGRKGKVRSQARERLAYRVLERKGETYVFIPASSSEVAKLITMGSSPGRIESYHGKFIHLIIGSINW